MSVLLSLSIQHQQQPNWCWAAVAASIGAYMNANNSAPSLSQCQIVSGVLQQPNCCVDASASQCNQEWYLDAALAYIGHLNGQAFQGSASFDSICKVISPPYNLPIGIGVSNGIAGHFLLIIGFNNDHGHEWVHVADPVYGYGTYDLYGVTNAYNGMRWTYTYPIK